MSPRPPTPPSPPRRRSFGALGHRSHGATDAKITSSRLLREFDSLRFAS
jgi:hypothetical protein